MWKLENGGHIFTPPMMMPKQPNNVQFCTLWAKKQAAQCNSINRLLLAEEAFSGQKHVQEKYHRYVYNLLLEHLKSIHLCVGVYLHFEILERTPMTYAYISPLHPLSSSGLIFRTPQEAFLYVLWVIFWTICSGNYYNFSKDISFKSLLLMKLKSIGWKQLLTISDQLTQSK